jgi:hypothetical protein
MVRKIKIFSTLQDVATMEVEINDWLTANQNVRVMQMMQTETHTPQGWNLIITIFYETG